MQAKKRAKPVKFGKAAKEKKEKVEASKKEEKKIDEAIEEKVKELKEKEEEEEKDAGKGAEEALASKVDDVDKEEKDSENKEEDIKEEDLDDAEDDSDDKIEEEVLTDEEINESETDDDDLDDDEIFAKPPDSYNNGGKGIFSYFMKVAIVTFILALVIFAGGYYAYTNQDKLLSFVSSPSPTPTEAPPAVPTSEPVNLAEFSIIVLNGTDVAGLAGDTQELLEDAGFEVVSVGNADDDYEETEIQAVESVSEEFLKELEEVLGKNFTIGETTSISTGEADVIINLGSPSASLN